MELDLEVQQDEWSLTGPTFGEDNQLTVVGWLGRNSIGAKFYIVWCNICSVDDELFPDKVFKSEKGNLVTGRVPCGCSKRPNWSKDQYSVLCTRKAVALGNKFVEFTGEWKKQHTKLKLLCKDHGEWGSTTITSLLNNSTSCPLCKVEVTVKRSKKPDDEMIQSFFDSGAFHPDTKFWRSERLTKFGVKKYWYMDCPRCGGTGESTSCGLQKGCIPCSCNMHRQQECYINSVIDEDSTHVAVKFGMSKDSKKRVKQQNSVSIYEIVQHLVYLFPDVASCKKAERECKKELQTGVVLSRDMPDGWSETTWIYNIDRIIEIYVRNGGVLKTASSGNNLQESSPYLLTLRNIAVE